ncbi:MAG: DUF362 domain-containing protein [Bacteroidales bacterium]|nr:DUF362 domain-containing protein [Bacteroidales bacterium]
MKRLFLMVQLVFVACAAFAQKQNLVLHYDFNKVEGNTVKDFGPNHVDAILMDGATAANGVMDLGEKGYLDMTAQAGKVMQQLSDFTIAAHYFIPKSVEVKGYGYFLWAFSAKEANAEKEGPYHAYRINEQRVETSLGGWSQETGIQMNKVSEQGKWISVIFRQQGTAGQLFINGELVGSETGFPLLKNIFAEASAYNWMGRAPFNGDEFLRNTQISDFRIYNAALTDIEMKDLLRAQQSSAIKMMLGANEPIGTPKGIVPGRVVWSHHPDAARWEGTGNWYDDEYNYQSGANWMVSSALTSLASAKTEELAWDKLFCYFNKQHIGKDRGYKKGEKVAIKINMNNTYSYEESGEVNASPIMVLALIRSLVTYAKVPQECITVFDASRYLTNGVFNTCHAAYPNVHYVDNVGEEGRTKTGYVENAIHYSVKSENMCTGLSTACTEANYIINMALLKGHVGQGVTLCGKNWYGVTNINKDWRKNAHVNMNQDRNGKPKYITFVDYMGHKDIGEKTMLYLIDGLYGCKLVDGAPGPKWQMAPFHNDWPCSLLASQDPVAIDCVGLDLIMSEFPDAPDLNFADAYLVEAALADNAPSGTKYDPEGDGTYLKSLGVAEHWNNAVEKKYTKINLVYNRFWPER